MVLPFPEQQAVLCNNTWCHRVPEGTVFGPLLFLIMMIGIDNGISHSSKLVSFADDTRAYSCINDIDKCDQLQFDLNSVYQQILLIAA